MERPSTEDPPVTNTATPAVAAAAVTDRIDTAAPLVTEQPGGGSTETSTTTGTSSGTTTTTTGTTDDTDRTTGESNTEDSVQNETLRPGSVVRAPSAPHSTASKKRRLALLKAKEELLKKEVELAAARIATLAEESDDDTDIEIASVSDVRTRTKTWVDQHSTLAPPLPTNIAPLTITGEYRTTVEEKPSQTQHSHATPINKGAKHSIAAPTTQGGCISTPVTAGEHVIAKQPSIEITQLAQAITLAARSACPTPRSTFELPTYSGSHTEWLSFYAAYTATAPSYSDQENLVRLRKSLKGMAKETVESLLMYNANPTDVMKTLQLRFGRPDAIAHTELDRLRALPRLSDSAKEVCVFATRVNNIVATLRALRKQQYLYNPEITKLTIDKLTPTIRYRWYDFAAEQSEDDADLLKLARFLEREAERCGPYAQPERDTASSQTQRTAPGAVQIRKQTQQRTYSTTEKDKTACPVCDKTGHTAVKCQQFTDANTDKRWEMAKNKSLCFRCLTRRTLKHECKARTCNTNQCNRTHHPMLHFLKREVPEEKTETVSTAWTTRRTHTFLKILPVKVSGPQGDVDTFALLDDGSTVTLVDADITNQVGIKGPSDPLRIEALSTDIGVRKSQRVTLTLHGATNTFDTHARTIENLQLSPQRIENDDLTECHHLSDIALQLVYEATPKILIGQDNWELLLATETRRGARHQPVASLTPLGWVLHGAHTRTIGHRINYITAPTPEDSMDEQLRQYFAIESLAIEQKRPQSDPEQRALNILAERTTRSDDGRYITSLLWHTDNASMPDNYNNAYNRLLSTEKKIDKDPLLKQKYNEQMEALIEKGYAEPAPSTKTANRTWYLPHFPVLNAMKPGKVRVVHDAAAKTQGVSLNDYLLTGPDLLQSLPGVLMRLRQHKYAVSADIKEMFMQVKIREQDRDALRYLWRGDNRGDTTPREYRMTSLIFGAKSSPATAIYIKNSNAERYKVTDPDAYDAIVRNHYVDDYLQSFETIEQAVATSNRVREIHSEAHYELRQWTSNSQEVLTALSEPSTTTQSVSLDENTKTERILGLIWKPYSDELAFNLDLARLPRDVLNRKQPTKREALKIVMSLFDPLGLASPVTSKAKQLLQEVWRRNIEWDQPIDTDLAAQWTEWIEHLKKLTHVAIPRCHLHYSDASNMQLHVFVDASETAFAAALYWRIQSPEGHVTTSLVLGKAKVAPLKVTSIPRLELQAAVMGSRMAATVIEEHDRKPSSVTYWSDSRTVLTWLKTGARSYKPYVAHRIAAIEEVSKLNEWRWVPTKLNVADDATRDVPSDFDVQHRWFRGPEFLRDDPTTWPAEKPPHIENTGEERLHYTTHRSVTTTTLTTALPDSNRFSKWERLLRATARVLQFIALCRRSADEKVNYKRTAKVRETDSTWGRKYRTATPRPTKQRDDSYRKFIPLDARYSKEAEALLVRASQQQSFKSEIDTLQKGGNIPHSSRLRPIAVELVNGVIQLKSRINAATDITPQTRAPAVIDGDNHVTKLYVEYIHRRLHHASVEATINECRQYYWILRLRPIARMLIHRCLPCRIRRSTPPRPPTGNHPPTRLAHHQRPFTYTGLDYFGPLTVTVGRGTQKRYVALFTCLTTRAVHLEIAASLTTDSAIMALRRMIARRGCPTEIWSDNGTNLQGADKELRKTIDRATEEEATHRKISWRFIPPAPPFMGGAWERLVRSVKTALYTVLERTSPSEEVLHTLLAEVEYTVNSRPLTHVSVDPADPEALTPNHFLLGGTAREGPPGTFDDSDLSNRTQWRASQRLADLFWTRWMREYLPELQNRREPHGEGTVKMGDVVLITDNTLPRNVWPRGIITATYPGTDNIVRVVDVKTKGGTLRRPVKKLLVLYSPQPPPIANQ
ncbi:uncharacterized protein LOC126381183 [Pectinophora gossypiella]|uniref:uncharacterized protein LOC126381183 n=1 Tax=Pectinophora gossypiella TaxID=13191 RepID=UPI00214E3C5D|nr:uncharacterized protein LOC126381183 [Pectinophora gossypiella]